ncbi:hypothetical protein, partial [Klebsiella pneumoniae]|uniref:hypothetical protein n=1 Tax=Klebsiella pneumoniae TaxID=573 RepID=UPI003B59EC00
ASRTGNGVNGWFITEFHDRTPETFDNNFIDKLGIEVAILKVIKAGSQATNTAKSKKYYNGNKIKPRPDLRCVLIFTS